MYPCTSSGLLMVHAAWGNTQSASLRDSRDAECWFWLAVWHDPHISRPHNLPVKIEPKIVGLYASMYVMYLMHSVILVIFVVQISCWLLYAFVQITVVCVLCFFCCRNSCQKGFVIDSRVLVCCINILSSRQSHEFLFLYMCIFHMFFCLDTFLIIYITHFTTCSVIYASTVSVSVGGGSWNCVCPHIRCIHCDKTKQTTASVLIPHEQPVPFLAPYTLNFCSKWSTLWNMLTLTDFHS